jgi:hypothetical protein
MGEVIEIRSFKTGKKYRYLINNIQSVSISLQTPATAMPLPLAGDANNILTKAEGNTCRISVSWTLHDEASDVVLANNYDEEANTVGGGTTPFGLGGGSGNQVRTADDQMKFLVNNQAESSPAYSGFQSTYIEDKYQFIMGNMLFSRVGLIESLEISKSGTTPITWNASISFLAGAPIAAFEDE